MQQITNVRVEAPSRLHLGLIDCGYATTRQFGGVGMSISAFPTVVEATEATDLSYNFNNAVEPEDRTVEDTAKLLGKIGELVGPIAVKVHQMSPEHIGLGSKTSLLLSIVTAANALKGAKLSRAESIELTGRGGTSGIGINSFWNGKLIVDSGHYTTQTTRVFAPSSRRIFTDVPTVTANPSMPTNWEVLLFKDNHADIETSASGEVNLFERVMPLNDIENLKSLAAVYHGIIPAVMEGNLERFAGALRDMNRVGMKRIEVGQQSPATVSLLEYVWDQGYAGGLSSMGPLVFVVRDKGAISQDLIDFTTLMGMSYLRSHNFDNKGVKITIA